MVLDIDTEFPFGKHAGLTVGWVLDNEPSYLVWLSGFDDHAIDPIVLDEARKAVERGEP